MELTSHANAPLLLANYVVLGRPNAIIAGRPASHILDRVEYLIELVESGLPEGSHTQNTYGQSTPHITGAEQSLFEGTDDFSQVPPPNSVKDLAAVVDGTAQVSANQVAREYFGSSEDVLAWPIFEGRYDRRWIEALIFDPTLPSDDLSGTPTSPRVTDDSIRNTFEDPRHIIHGSAGICEEDVPQLIEAFLLNVHIKNPIFDPEYLRKMAKSVVDHGFNWEASSCLVVKVYYTASRKRIGLLKDTLLATECHFMAGVYEMYSLRPLQAAISFNRACVTFQTLTRMRTEYYIAESQLGKARASRLYWSCLKSEHEVSIEIQFPSSGLTKLNYTSAFPPPPSSTSTEEWYRMHTEPEAESPQSVHSAWTQSEFEHGWYYYLADIAARRLLQRVIELFYKASESAWLELSFSSIVHTVEELDRQLAEWEVQLQLFAMLFESRTDFNLGTALCLM
ncbi:Zcf27p [Kalmusia sp. IMI 367209]|nr:Zcf27p [Kalmusia sp. IMI 367209]